MSHAMTLTQASPGAHAKTVKPALLTVDDDGPVARCDRDEFAEDLTWQSSGQTCQVGGEILRAGIRLPNLLHVSRAEPHIGVPR